MCDNWPGSLQAHLTKPWIAELTANQWQWQVWDNGAEDLVLVKESIPINVFQCQGIIVQLCMGNRLFHTKFNSYRTTCYFFWVKIPKSTNKSYKCNVCTLTVLSLIKRLYCICSNNYGKRYNHDASSDVNDRSELCLSSLELHTGWLRNLAIWFCVQMVSHSLARHGSISELFYHEILSG